jgi:hypothetical protein
VKLAKLAASREKQFAFFSPKPVKPQASDPIQLENWRELADSQLFLLVDNLERGK